MLPSDKGFLIYCCCHNLLLMIKICLVQGNEMLLVLSPTRLFSAKEIGDCFEMRQKNEAFSAIILREVSDDTSFPVSSARAVCLYDGLQFCIL